MEPFERRMNVVVEPRQALGDASRARRVTSETDRDIGGYWWKNNDRIVYIRDFGGDENFHLFAVDKDGSNLIDLTPFEGVKVDVIDELEEHDTEVLIGMNQRNPELFDAYRLNIVTGEMQLVAENPGNVLRWVTDHTGALRIAVASDGVNSTLLHRQSESEPFTEIITTNFKESLDPLFFTFDNRDFFAISNLGRDKAAIVRYDVAARKESEVLFEHPEVDVEGLAFSKKRKVLTTIAYTTWKQQRHFLDRELESIFTAIQTQLPGYEVNVVDMTKDEMTYVIRTYSDRSLGSFYLFDVPTGELTKLCDVGSWLPSEHLAEMKPIRYQTRDGLTIHGYLTLPVGVEPKNLSVIVNPHGGPWVRDRWTYNPEVQFLANRGYAVLQVNYRGSTGYGRAFWESSFKQWGRKMQDDLTDGARYLIDAGIAAPDRIGIYGASYGGYATLAGLTFTPEVYACGVDYVGVSNLLTFIQTIPPYWKPFLEMMYEMVGNPETEEEYLREASPVFHADRIQVPLLVIQGARDPRVNINESDQIVEALKRHGVDVEYLVKENEGHGFHNEENRFEVYETMERFLGRYLPHNAPKPKQKASEVG
jgi:dipeptidyl aminopeptidase/acylaminoacyl peptidase